MRGQAAIEYMAIVGIVLAILLPLTAYIWQNNAGSTSVRQADIAANTIKQSADSLWAQGPGARNRISVFFPPGYNSTGSHLSNGLVRLSIAVPGGTTDVLAITKANITGTLPATPGYAWLDMTMQGNVITVTPVS